MFLVASTILLIVVLILTAFAFYHLFRMPGSHKLKNINNKEKLERPAVIKSVLTITVFVLLLVILEIFILTKR